MPDEKISGMSSLPSPLPNNNIFLPIIDLNEGDPADQNKKIAPDVLGSYNTQLDNSILVANSVGGISAGTPISSLKNRPIVSILDDILVPTLSASIGSNNSASLTGISSGQVMEVGSSVAPDLSLSYNKGQINNGNGTSAGPLTGDLNKVDYKIGATVVTQLSGEFPGTNNSGPVNVVPAHIIVKGTNQWNADAHYDAGTTTYTDNKGVAQSVPSIENAKAAAFINVVSTSISGRYYMYISKGIPDSSPTDSSLIRNLEKNFLSTSDTGVYSTIIPPLTKEVSFYVIRGRTIKVNDSGSPLNTDITNAFNPTDLQVEDAAGVLVNYTLHTIDLGAGFPDQTTFQITIT